MIKDRKNPGGLLPASNWVKSTCRDIQTAVILRRAPILIVMH